MQKDRYINQNQFQKKVTVLILMLCLILILLLLNGVLKNIQNKNTEKEERIKTENFNSIQEILEYYGCQFIKMKEYTEGEFLVDIYTTFQHDLYENEKSNEEFFQNVINAIAKFLNDKNFRMFDEQKQEKIEIHVICQKGKIQTVWINGMEDYFIYKDSQKSLKQYQEIKVTDISIQSEELQNCINNNWSTKTNFGTRETIFQNYYVYFEEGIETRKIHKKIYNIIFTKNYVKPVVNGFTVGEKRDIIIRELGTPTFENEDKTIIGYKSKDMYVFFEEDQISIYRNSQEEGFDEFFELVDSFLKNELTVREFMNQLTYLWPDYEEYTYDAETVFLSYPNRGIDIKMNVDDTNGIIFYNNVGIAQDKINSYLEHTEFIAMLQVDNVYRAEERRVDRKAKLLANCEEYKAKYEQTDSRNRGEMYDYYMKMSSNDNIICTYFIARKAGYPNCELSENIHSYIWLNEHCFVYSVQNRGIYYYDLQSQIKGVLVTGEQEFQIKSYENHRLQYDDKEIEIH